MFASEGGTKPTTASSFSGTISAGGQKGRQRIRGTREVDGRTETFTSNGSKFSLKIQESQGRGHRHHRN